jgi:hypothetical protein
MAEDLPEASKPGAGLGVFGALGLSPKACLVVGLLALLVWWYFQNQGMALTSAETAVVVLGLALALVVGRTVWGRIRRLRAPTPGKTGGMPK